MIINPRTDDGNTDRSKPHLDIIDDKYVVGIIPKDNYAWVAGITIDPEAPDYFTPESRNDVIIDKKDIVFRIPTPIESHYATKRLEEEYPEYKIGVKRNLPKPDNSAL